MSCGYRCVTVRTNVVKLVNAVNKMCAMVARTNVPSVKIDCDLCVTIVAEYELGVAGYILGVPDILTLGVIELERC